MKANTSSATVLKHFNTLFVHETNRGSIQFLRYGFVAGVAFVADFGLLYVFTSLLHFPYLVSTTLSFTLSAVVNYILSVAWVFTQRNKRQRSAEVTIFITICFIALLLNDFFMWLFTSKIGLFYLVSKLITVSIVFFWSYAARRMLFNATLRNARMLRRYVPFLRVLSAKNNDAA